MCTLLESNGACFSVKDNEGFALLHEAVQVAAGGWHVCCGTVFPTCGSFPIHVMPSAMHVCYDSRNAMCLNPPQSGGADMAALMQWNDSNVSRSRQRTLPPQCIAHTKSSIHEPATNL